MMDSVKDFKMLLILEIMINNKNKFQQENYQILKRKKLVRFKICIFNFKY